MWRDITASDLCFGDQPTDGMNLVVKEFIAVIATTSKASSSPASSTGAALELPEALVELPTWRGGRRKMYDLPPSTAQPAPVGLRD